MHGDARWDADELFLTIHQIDQLLPSLEAHCAEIACELSGMEVTPQMFRRMGGMWLMHFVHQLAAINSEDSTENNLLDLTIPFDSWTHHQLFVGDSGYRSQIFSLIDLVKSGRIGKLKNAEVRGVGAPRTNRIRRGLETLIQGPGRHHEVVTVVRPYIKQSLFSRMDAIRRTRRDVYWNDLEFAIEVGKAPNLSARKSLSIAIPVGGFESLVRAALPLMLPTCFSEELSGIVKSIDLVSERTTAIYSANGSQAHLPYQIVSAMWGEKGTKILSHQHGGHQGLDEICAAENYEVRASDRHYTMGWSDSRPSVKPLLVAMPQRASSLDRSRLLLMSLANSTVAYRLQPFCLPSHVQRCASETRQFIGNLKWPTKPVVRCESADIATLKLPESVSYEDFDLPGTVSASRSGLVIHNYLGVSWLETLAMNIPTVCFVPKGIHRFRAAAQPFIDALANAGIIHYSGREAADFVNSLRGNPSSWWRLAEVQEAREAFVARYANFSENWLEAWQAEFESLLAE